MPRPRVPRDEIRSALSEGLRAEEVADRCGCSRRTVARVIAEIRRERAEGQSILGLDVPAATVADLHRRWIAIAGACQSQIAGELRAGRPANHCAYTGGVATQRALECQRYLDQHRGLPETVPEDEEERAAALKQIAYRKAKAGSGTGLSEALKAAQRDTKVLIAWQDPPPPEEAEDRGNGRSEAPAPAPGAATDM